QKQQGRGSQGGEDGHGQQNCPVGPQGEGVVEAHLGREGRQGCQQRAHQKQAGGHFLRSHEASSWGEIWQRQVARGKVRPSKEGVSGRSGVWSRRLSSASRSA